ncbi:hypothetical protein BDY24DRAFT_418133 [Mrakia frigida]|uniref:uncharacterized protein n=1 Tax=Mrakia frigida TaxID=29902 RepID=UPI003FCC0C29
MSSSPIKLRIVTFSLPTETILLQLLLLPPSSHPSSSSSSTHHHLPTTLSDPTSPLPLSSQALSSAQTLLSRSQITLLPVDFFFEGEKLVDSLLPFTITTDEEDASKTAWFVGIVHPGGKDEGHGEWFGRPEAVLRVESELDKATIKRAVGLVRAKTDRHYL